MRITRTLATAGLTLAALGIAGGSTIASAAPHTPSGMTTASTQSQSGDKPGKPEIRSVAVQEGPKKVAAAGNGRSLAFAQDGRDNFHP
ncbi:hypothetical protein [Streptomyces sp. NPDC056883]|uniref:hypothetical protein n=1 Tax=Streptomyces sp. NPDC056883 TaxID=3345959 RepID=UPI00367953DF